MKPTNKFWALSVSRIASGEGDPARLVERVTLKENIRAEEGAIIDHPRLGKIALFLKKHNLAATAYDRFAMHQVNSNAFTKRYGHWLDGGKA